MSVATIHSSKNMPSAGPEALDLMFRLGVLTTDQLRLLLRCPVSVRRVRTVLAALRTGRPAGPALAVTVRRSFPFSANSDGRQWTHVHHLTTDGVTFAGARRKLHRKKALSLYAGVLQEATIDHALLRNEFYAALAGAIASDAGPASLSIETMLGEGGMTPMEVTPRKSGGRTWLNPDGLLQLASDEDPTFHQAFFLESDTGSEDMPWQVRSHAEKYAEQLVKMLEAEPAGAPRVPKVLFVSPTLERSRWVRQVLFALGGEEGTRFRQARRTFQDHGQSFPAQFVFTNLEWLASHGALGSAYWSLTSNELSTPF